MVWERETSVSDAIYHQLIHLHPFWKWKSSSHLISYLSFLRHSGAWVEADGHPSGDGDWPRPCPVHRTLGETKVQVRIRSDPRDKFFLIRELPSKRKLKYGRLSWKPQVRLLWGTKQRRISQSLNCIFAFLAVHNSSIGDLVTHLVTNSTFTFDITELP